jgi:hypothetical protein
VGVGRRTKKQPQSGLYCSGLAIQGEQGGNFAAKHKLRIIMREIKICALVDVMRIMAHIT